MRGEAVELAEILFKTRAIAFGEFTLTSGIKSPVYVDLRRLPSYPREFRRVVSMLSSILEEFKDRVNCIVGVATAGIVWGSVLAYLHSRPFAYFRGKRKEHGTGRLVEGEVASCNAVIVDDVATTGSSLAAAVEAVRSEKGNPIAALVIVDREQGAREKLRELGVELRAVATLREVLRAAARMGLASAEDVNRVLTLLYGEG